MKNILMVCHGNICRSTMAEFVMKDLVRKAGLTDEIHIQSAATHRDELGSDTYYGTKDILRAKGVPFTPRHAVLMKKSDYDKYDLIIGMDFENMKYINRIIGSDPEGKVHLLMSYAGENREVADPWYTRDFSETYDDVLRGCTALLEELKMDMNNA